MTGITSGPPGLGFGRISRTGGICGLPGISSSRRGLSLRSARVRKLRFAVGISVTPRTLTRRRSPFQQEFSRSMSVLESTGGVFRCAARRPSASLRRTLPGSVLLLPVSSSFIPSQMFHVGRYPRTRAFTMRPVPPGTTLALLTMFALQTCVRPPARAREPVAPLPCVLLPTGPLEPLESNVCLGRFAARSACESVRYDRLCLVKLLPERPAAVRYDRLSLKKCDEAHTYLSQEGLGYP